MKIVGESLVRSEVASGNSDDGRTSKKLITDTRDSELNLSVDRVMSNEDLLIEILLRLPVISLLLFKVVSKHWSSIITSPNFTSRLNPSMAPCGLFFRRPFEALYDFLSLDSRIPSKRSITTFSFCPETGYKSILSSCNGLLLFYSAYYPHKLYVYNPTINLFKMLPRQSLINIDFGVIMAFDPAKSPHYKVLSPNRKDGAIQMLTYSSETNTWSVCGLRHPCQRFLDFNKGLYWNDAIHWLDFYSKTTPSHVMLDVVDNTVLTTKLLPRPLDKRVSSDHKFFRSHGCLLLICKEYHYSQQLFVNEMRNRKSGWFVKYFINFDDIIMNTPLSQTNGCVLYYESGEREEDSFMVLNLSGKVVEYKPLLNTFRELLILGTNSLNKSYEFISSFVGV